MKEPIYRRPLNTEQLNILHALYLFRFGTTDLLLTRLSKRVSRQYMNTRLKILCEQEYIGRRYDSSYKLQARFATYYLLPKGTQVLKERFEDVKKPVLRSIKNDANVSDRFIQHCLNIFTVYATLHEQYNGTFKFDTKTDMNGREDYPEPLPGAYIAFSNTPGMDHTKFLLECIDNTKPQKIWRQRITQLIEYVDTAEWPEDYVYPVLLFVCATPQIERKMQRWAYQAYEDALAEGVYVATATMETVAQAVLHAKSPEAFA